MTHRIKTTAIAAVASALAVTGMAVAHGGGNGDGGRSFDFPSGKSFTYSETHLRKHGEDVTLRADQGKVLAASDSAISIKRNDGETVEVPVDGDTRLHGWWRSGHDAKASHHGNDDDGDDNRPTVGDIPEGKRVVVLRTDDDPAAEAVTVTKRHHRFHRHHDRD